MRNTKIEYISTKNPFTMNRRYNRLWEPYSRLQPLLWKSFRFFLLANKKMPFLNTYGLVGNFWSLVVILSTLKSFRIFQTIFSSSKKYHQKSTKSTAHKSHIQETLNLLVCAESSRNTIKCLVLCSSHSHQKNLCDKILTHSTKIVLKSYIYENNAKTMGYSYIFSNILVHFAFEKSFWLRRKKGLKNHAIF